MDIREALLTLRRRWALILVCTLLGVAAAVLSLFAQPVLYSSQAELYVTATGASNTSDVQAGNTAGQQVAASLAQVATTSTVLQRAKDDLKLRQSVDTLASYVTVTVPTNTVVMQIAVRAPSPVLAARLANTVASEIGVQLAQLNPNVGNAASVLRTSSLQVAAPDSTPVSPKVPNTIGTGLLIGFAVGVLLALVMRLLTRRILTPADVASISDVPVVGTVPEIRAAGLSVVMQTESHAPAFAEAIRELRANIRFLAPGASSRVILITSAKPEDGKSTVAANLAAGLALLGQRTLLVDADMRRPSLHDLWSLDDAVGLSTALLGDHGLQSAVVQVGPPKLHLLPAGPVPPNPGELCGSDRFAELLDEMRAEWDVVVIDSPPVQHVADALVLASQVDGVVVAVRAQKTLFGDLAGVLEKLRSNHAAIFGVVLSRVQPRDLVQYGAYYADYRSPAAKTSTTTNPGPSSEPLTS